MECNKDEAMRAKDIAVRKFTEKDFTGAKKFAVKAQNLFPDLDGISQMLTTVDVHISAENKVSGEMDLYGMLGVNPMADDDTIKKQYRKLLLLLHPDKNKSIGADNAFQLVSEAFTILSDKTKRSAYNRQRHVRMAQKVPLPSSGVQKVSFPLGGGQKVSFPSGGGQKVSFPSGGGQKVSSPSGGGQSGSQVQQQPSTGRAVVDQKVPAQSKSPATAPNGAANGNYKRRKGGPRGKYQKKGVQKASQQAQSFFKKGETFWTVCARCKMQYEYMRVYLNQILKCPNCEIGFVALEVPQPSNMAPLRQENGPLVPGVGSLGGSSSRWSPFTGTTAYNNGSECLKKEKKGGPAKRMREMGDNLVLNFGSRTSSQPGTKDVDINGRRANGFQEYNVRLNTNRELSSTELKKLLAEKACMELKSEVRKVKLSQEKNAALEEKANVKQKSNLAKLTHPHSQTGPQTKISIATSSGGNVKKEAPEFTVPDPDFHIFDHDRSEICFKENQVWAAYDNDDGMPRFYALIHEVVSVDPFKLKVSWLNSRSTSEFGPLDWVGRGFRKNCGDYWVGKHEMTHLLNSFSHKVKFDKGPRGVIQIYPKEGDIWALYRNWSPNWNQRTSDETVRAYDMVEVLSDYSDAHGVYVAPIIKAHGYRTVFREQPDQKVVKQIPKEEMFRFSHQVPHHILTGYEKPNAPKGYVELDPAATPLELLQVSGPDNIIDLTTL